MRTLLIAALFIGLNLNAQDSPFIKQADSGMLPVLKENFRPQISIAPQVAFMSFSDLDTSGFGYGVEIALQCPLACTRKNYIRQQISFLYFNDDESNYKYWTAGINPEYRLFVSPEYEFAIGPSVGFFRSEASDVATSGLNYGVSSSINVHFGKVFIGLSPRYILSKKVELSESEFSQNHIQGLFKFGLKF